MNNSPSRRKTKGIHKSLSRDTWRKIHQWHLVLPPARPSLYHLETIRNKIEHINRSSSVGVLGCTPEYRDMLFEMGFKKVYLFDKSKISYRRMNSIRAYDNEEKLILGDWITTLPHFKGIFSLILSDLTSGNVPYDRQSTFYSAISGALEDNGIFIDKILTHSGPKRAISDLELKFSRLPVNLLYITYFSCEFLFCSELLDIKQIVDSTLFYDILHKKLRSPRLKRFLAESPKITPFGTFWYYGKDWAEISQYYFHYLQADSIYQDEESSPFYGNLKIIISKRKIL